MHRLSKHFSHSKSDPKTDKQKSYFARLQESFAKVDKTKSGFLSKKGIGKLSKLMDENLTGTLGFHSKKLDRAFTDMDINGDGKVTLENYYSWHLLVSPTSEEEYKEGLQMMFTSYDRDSDETLDKAELRELLKHSMTWRDSSSTDRVMADFENLDDDIKLSFIAFYDWYKKAHLKTTQVDAKKERMLIRAQFDAIDGDGSGTLSKEEVKELIRRVGSSKKKEDLLGLSFGSSLNEAFDEMDPNKEDHKEAVRRKFFRLDSDGDGLLSKEEVRKLAETLGIKPKLKTVFSGGKRLNRAFKEMDLHNTGHADFEGFYAWYRREYLVKMHALDVILASKPVRSQSIAEKKETQETRIKRARIEAEKLQSELMKQHRKAMVKQEHYQKQFLSSEEASKIKETVSRMDTLTMNELNALALVAVKLQNAYRRWVAKEAAEVAKQLKKYDDAATLIEKTFRSHEVIMLVAKKRMEMKYQEAVKKTNKQAIDEKVLHAHFQMLDEDNDSTLNNDEFKEMMKRVRHDDNLPELNDDEVNAAFSEIDENKNGKIGYDEFKKWHRRMYPKTEKDRRDRAGFFFKKLDTNNDGKIDEEKIGQLGLLTGKELKDAFRSMGGGEDKEVDFPKFYQWWKKERGEGGKGGKGGEAMKTQPLKRDEGGKEGEAGQDDEDGVAREVQLIQQDEDRGEKKNRVKDKDEERNSIDFPENFDEEHLKKKNDEEGSEKGKAATIIEKMERGHLTRKHRKKFESKGDSVKDAKEDPEAKTAADLQEKDEAGREDAEKSHDLPPGQHGTIETDMKKGEEKSETPPGQHDVADKKENNLPPGEYERNQVKAAVQIEKNVRGMLARKRGAEECKAMREDGGPSGTHDAVPVSNENEDDEKEKNLIANDDGPPGTHDTVPVSNENEDDEKEKNLIANDD
eukprot:g5381.t1